MDIRLIRANIALFENDRLAVQQLLEDYRHADGEETALVHWLEAHAQSDHDALYKQLEKLLRRTEPSDPYHQMAKAYLKQEDDYQAQIDDIERRSRTVPGVTRRRVGLAIVSLALIIWLIPLGIAQLRGNDTEDTTVAAVQPTAFIQPTAEPTALPDHSIRLNINDYTGRYEAGLLQIAAVEDQSERIVDSISGEIISPIEGARFYALEVYFECRLGICTEPPEASLSMALSNDLVILPNEGAQVQGSEMLTSIALGRRTTGWIVFEVPVISEPKDLIITPRDRRSRLIEVVIPLPVLESP